MKNRHSNTQEPLNDMTTVSVLLEPRGSIFQNGFLYGVQFKFGPSKSVFLKKFVYFYYISKPMKISKTHYGVWGWGSSQEWGSI